MYGSPVEELLKTCRILFSSLPALVEFFLCLRPFSELACQFLDVCSAAVDFLTDGPKLLLGLNPNFPVLLLRGLGRAVKEGD